MSISLIASLAIETLFHLETLLSFQVEGILYNISFSLLFPVTKIYSETVNLCGIKELVAIYM